MATKPRSVKSRARQQQQNTSQQVLDVAERLVQVRGFNAFSYADVATELGITNASLHYHFPGKAALGQALITRYAERFLQTLEQIDTEAEDAPSKLTAYADLYADTLRGQRMCLCGMLAADYQTLPKPMADAVVKFFDDNERWLERVLEQGRTDNTLKLDGSAVDTARLIIGGLEGAMLVARPYGDLARFENTALALLATLAGTDSR